MRILKSLLAATAIASMAVTPVVATASAASKLSLRASTQGKKSNKIASDALIAIAIVATSLVGGLVIAEGAESDSP